MTKQEFYRQLVEAVKYRIYQHRKRDRFKFNIYIPTVIKKCSMDYLLDDEEILLDTDIINRITTIGEALGYDTFADTDLKNERIIHVECEKI